jgi:DNA-binding response OmpR family regulator
MKALAGKLILVVDDEEMLRDLLQNVFITEGAQVAVAENGSKAFELCRANRFDAVITDVRMPGGDGVSLVRDLHAHFKEPPLLFVCSGFNDLVEGVVESLGICRVFEKPFNLREMIDVVRTKLTRL